MCTSFSAANLDAIRLNSNASRGILGYNMSTELSETNHSKTLRVDDDVSSTNANRVDIKHNMVEPDARKQARSRLTSISRILQSGTNLAGSKWILSFQCLDVGCSFIPVLIIYTSHISAIQNLYFPF